MSTLPNTVSFSTPIAPLLSVRDVAEMLGVSAAFIYQHTGGGREPMIPHVKIGGNVRFRRERIEAFIEELERA